MNNSTYWWTKSRMHNTKLIFKREQFWLKSEYKIMKTKSMTVVTGHWFGRWKQWMLLTSGAQVPCRRPQCRQDGSSGDWGGGPVTPGPQLHTRTSTSVLQYTKITCKSFLLKAAYVYKENSENQSKLYMLFPSTKKNWKQGILDTEAANSWESQQFIPLLTDVKMTCHLISHTIG